MKARDIGAEKGSGRRLAGGAALLAASAVIAKIVGACYRVPLTNILGAEGIGLYQLVFPVFALMTTLSSAGIPSALARTVAEKRGAGESPVKGEGELIHGLFKKHLTLLYRKHPHLLRDR